MSHSPGALEDDTILSAIESLEKAAAQGESGRGDEAAQTLERLYVELLGVLAYDLPPLAPPPEIKRRLMAAIAGDETQEVPDQQIPALGRRNSSASTAHRQAEAAPDRRAGSRAQPAAAGRVQVVNWRRAPPRAVGVLAAVLILALLGLSGRLTYLFFAQRETIAALSARLRTERLNGHPAPGGRDARQLRQQLDDMRDKLALVTSPAVTVSALHPTGSAPSPSARGVLFVAADHQHWMLSVSGLPSTDRGRCYQLWFIDDAGAHSGGTFQVTAPGPVEISSPRMPPGTRDARVTLESCPGSPAPAGPEILAAGQFQRL